MYLCKQQGSGNSFPRGLARVKQLISFEKEAGRGFVSRLLVTVGQGPAKNWWWPWGCLQWDMSLQPQPTSHLCQWDTAGCNRIRSLSEREGSCTGRKIKTHSSVFPADRSLNTGWELGSGPCVKFSLACLETAALLPEHPTSISVIAGGIRPTCQACCYLCKFSVPEGSLKNKSPFYSALDAGSEPAN